jgi:hypothetical protein
LARLGQSQQAALLTLSVDEFLRRFLLHLLPRGFVRIRYFGFLATRRRAALLPLCFSLLGRQPLPSAAPAESALSPAPSLWKCPLCDGPMVIVERFTALQFGIRPPPFMPVSI